MVCFMHIKLQLNYSFEPMTKVPSMTKLLGYFAIARLEFEIFLLFSRQRIKYILKGLANRYHRIAP